MTPDLPPLTPIDGIAPPTPVPIVPPLAAAPVPSAPVTQAPEPPKKKTSSLNLAVILYGMVAVIYVLPAFVLMAILPRPDGSFEQAKQIGTAAYGLGTLLWLGFAIIGASRISSIKDKPRLRLVAMARLLIGTVPLMIIGATAVALINLPPKLGLELVSPTSSSSLIAPLSVTFGMQTALKVFQQDKLTPLKYEWDYNGDGKIDQQTFDPKATILFNQSGIFAVAAKVTMTDGTTKFVRMRLVIPRVSFGLDPIIPIVEEPVTFSIVHLFPTGGDNPPKLQKAKWDFDGDGVTDLESDKLQVSTLYHKLGPVNVSVNMTLMNQTQTTLQRTIEIVKPPDQPFPIKLETEPQTLLGPPPFGVVFALKTKEQIANVTWDFGDQKNGEGLRVAHVFPAVGNYIVNAIARSQSGAVAKLSKTVRVTNPLNINDLSFEGKPTVQGYAVEGQVPLTVDITPITALPLITFSWDAQNASEVLATDKSFHAVYRDEGRFYVDLIGVDPDQNVFRKRITVNASAPQSFVSFTMSPPTPTAPAAVTFDASDTFVPSGEQITGFEWDFGDGASSDGTTKFSGSRIDHTFTKPGTYSITLNVRTVSNQVYNGKQTLLVKAPLIDACILPSRNSGKAPFGVHFDSSCSTGNFDSWLWDFSDNAQSDQPDVTHVFSKAGNYKVTLTAKTKDGHSSTKTVTITVTPP